ncbi:hypothetical protein [Allorhizocola rhizosphaerae]|uniref:hypothetical protein n=1 Tax=Allorhizocola rhizosphaerae TaxID=1872709 RepID=UPI0013C32781|nr:hypothetical protein [Allorhizocola rhizosphaerae]
MTSAEEAWQAMKSAEDAYYRARMAFVAAGPEAVLREQLGGARGRATALRVLADLLPDHTVNLCPEVFEVAVSSERDLALARQVISRVEPARLSRVLPPVVRRFLADEQRDSWQYRRAAELLDLLGQTELLSELVEKANHSKDHGIRDVGRDFGAA